MVMKIAMMVLAALSTTISSSAVAQSPIGRPVVEPIPRDLEVELALSALPERLRAAATVYVLNPSKGFEIERQGSNGFSTLVSRIGDDTFKGSWPLTQYRTDILYPISFDAAGAKAAMRIFLDAATLQAQGMEPRKLKELMQQRDREGYYKPPERPGISYMMAPVMRTYDSPEKNEAVTTISYPHVMYFASGIRNEDIGGGTPGGMEPFVILEGHHGYMIQPLGTAERAALQVKYASLLTRLCEFKKIWCLPKK